MISPVVGVALAASLAAALPAQAPAQVPAGEGIAYQSIVSTTPSGEREAILAARNEIILGDQAWTIDGAVSKFNVATGAVEELPDFYDLFPADWDVPVTSAVTLGSMPGEIYSASVQAPGSDNSVYYYTSREIPSKAELGGSTRPFYTFQIDETGRDVGVTVTDFDPDQNATFNAGFVNAGGESVGWVPGLRVAEEGAAMGNLKMNRSYGVVINMAKTGGDGKILVDYADLMD